MSSQSIKQQERRIGRRAASMATRHLRANVSRQFSVKNKGGVFDGRTIAPMLKASRVRMKMGEHRLLGLDATSNKFAFVHHYGFNANRSASFVRFSSSRYVKQFTQRSAHIFRLKERSIFEGLYANSGALSYLSGELVATRGEAEMLRFNEFVKKMTSDEE